MWDGRVDGGGGGGGGAPGPNRAPAASRPAPDDPTSGLSDRARVCPRPSRRRARTRQPDTPRRRLARYRHPSPAHITTRPVRPPLALSVPTPAASPRQRRRTRRLTREPYHRPPPPPCGPSTHAAGPGPTPRRLPADPAPRPTPRGPARPPRKIERRWTPRPLRTPTWREGRSNLLLADGRPPPQTEPTPGGTREVPLTAGGRGPAVSATARRAQ